jgi:hypothetical protein
MERRLVLRRSGEFEWTAVCCLGTIGHATGRWSIAEGGVKLTARTKDGAAKDRLLSLLRIVKIVKFRQQYWLVQGTTEIERDGWRPTAACFHKEKAREVLEEEATRLLEEAARKAEMTKMRK